MGFVKRIWKDRIVEFKGRRKLTDVSTGVSTVVDVERVEGSVLQEGDAFSKANMDDLEQRIDDEFSVINNKLTANNIPFIFDYKNGKYGYNTDPERGADTFFPFSEIDRLELIYALVNSGLGLTEESTPEEIYAALATKFPPTKSMIVAGWTLSGNNPATSLTSNTSLVKMIMGSGSQMTSYMNSPVFDISAFKTLELSGESYKITGNIFSDYTPKMYLVNSTTGAKTLIYEHPNYDTKFTKNNIFVTYNTSSLTGNYYLQGQIYSYESRVLPDGVGNNGSSNQGAYISLSKALLSA